MFILNNLKIKTILLHVKSLKIKIKLNSERCSLKYLSFLKK
jgi:hypothetical protein